MTTKYCLSSTVAAHSNIVAANTIASHLWSHLRTFAHSRCHFGRGPQLPTDSFGEFALQSCSALNLPYGRHPVGSALNPRRTEWSGSGPVDPTRMPTRRTSARGRAVGAGACTGPSRINTSSALGRRPPVPLPTLRAMVPAVSILRGMSIRRSRGAFRKDYKPYPAGGMGRSTTMSATRSTTTHVLRHTVPVPALSMSRGSMLLSLILLHIP